MLVTESSLNFQKLDQLCCVLKTYICTSSLRKKLITFTVMIFPLKCLLCVTNRFVFILTKTLERHVLIQRLTSTILISLIVRITIKTHDEFEVASVNFDVFRELLDTFCYIILYSFFLVYFIFL